jgi:hypothetical protein
MEWKLMALPRDGAEVTDLNGFKKSLGSNCLIAYALYDEPSLAANTANSPATAHTIADLALS